MREILLGSPVIQASADGCTRWAQRRGGNTRLHYNHTTSMAARLECSIRERISSISGLRNPRCERVTSLVSTPLHYSLGAPLARQSEDVAPTCFNGAKFSTSSDGVKFTTVITTSPVTNRPLRHWWSQQKSISGAGETLRGGKGEAPTEQPLLAHALCCKDASRSGYGLRPPSAHADMRSRFPLRPPSAHTHTAKMYELGWGLHLHLAGQPFGTGKAGGGGKGGWGWGGGERCLLSR